MKYFAGILLAGKLLTSCGVSDLADTLAVDVLMKGGTVYVGDLSDPFVGDVAVLDDEIVFVGKDSLHIRAETVLDVSGQIVSPGFIDPHTHSLSDLQADEGTRRKNDNYRFQGVTTVINGNDGFGHPDISAIARDLETKGIGTNTALFVGHGGTRTEVMGKADRSPTPDELAQMETWVETGMQAGALGLSTGLFYAPGSFADTEEVIALSRVAAKYGGIYDSHIRDEATYNIGLEAAIEEVLEIGREAEIPVHIAHIKALGVDVWGKSKPIIDTINRAREAGQKITADQYPWPASGTRISNALLPRWVKSDSDTAYIARLNDLNLREKILSETKENLRRRGGPEAVLITQDKEGWLGLTLGEIAKNNNLPPSEMAIEIAKRGDARIASFNMNADDIANFMSQPWVMTSSDGSNGHPRKYASFPRKYETYVTKKEIMDLKTFIHRSSGLTAETFGICERGFLRNGFKADILVFDPDNFSQVADFQNPAELSIGVTYLFINGKAAVFEGVSREALPGQVLKRCEKSVD